MAASGSRKTRSERVAALELPPSKFERALTSLGQRDVLLRLGIGVLAAVVLAAVLHSWSTPFSYRTDYVFDRDVVARAPFQVFDLKATEDEESLARSRARAVYDQNPEPLVQLRAKLRNTIVELAAAQKLDDEMAQKWAVFQPPLPEGAPPPSLEEQEKRFQRFKEEVTGEERLAKIDQAVASALERYEKYGLLKQPVKGNQDEILVYRNDRPGVEEPVTVSDVILRPHNIKAALTQQLGSTELADHLFAWLQPKLANMETLTLDVNRTKASQEKAAENVEDVFTNYKIGDVLAKRGEPLGRNHLDLLLREHRAAEAQRTLGSMLLRILAVLAIISVLFWLCSLYLFHRQRRLLFDWRRLSGLLLLIVLTLAVGRWAARDPWCAEIVPLLLFGQIIAIVYNRELALLLAGTVALFLVIALGLGLGEFLILFGSTATAVLQLSHIRSRSKLIIVGFYSGLVAGLLTVSLALIDNQSLHWPLIFDAVQNAGLTLASGFLMTGLLPLIERMFGVLTDISLLELGDVAHPLLQELIRRAPSTYNHSITVGSIAEAAAEAIGARGLLVRVGAYFHDIGKMLKPGYFIENQGDEASRHETLVPAMSTLVIIAHIKDGANLARQHHLPEPIIDFILQHHGTTLVGYFYERASQQKRDNPDGDKVDESTFRYPGPKPQTKEAAVLMLADAVESASRTLVGPTPARIDGLVREIAERRLEDGQFDESGLTLRELRIIEDTMIKTVTAIYHGRVKYPDQRTT
ncbi:MAG: HDIG domain-containing protein [Pirellulales bacterium]|nr:HDIG domain-containing protein [Pirellulales bacterium]